MQELVREYLNDFGKKKKRHRRFTTVAIVFAVAVVGTVIWGLARTGIATTGEVKCGKEEHQHTEECYTNALVCGVEESSGHTHTDACYQTADPTLICGMEESEEHAHTEECYQTTDPVLVCGQEESEGHMHSDACYNKELSCGKEEHQHTEECYIDKSADVEDESVWTTQYEGVEWKDEWGKDLVIAAKLQLDYKESVANYIVAEDGSHKGYTRYGQFADDMYIDWDAAFVNFCMYYAGLTSSEMFPEEKDTQEWYDKFIKDDEGKKQVYLTTPDGYEPQEGDLIFLKKENEETKFQMGIVSSYNKEDKEKNEIKVIEGNSDNRVKENTYDINDEHIFEYLKISEMEKAYKQPEEETKKEETEAKPEEDKTIITTETEEEPKEEETEKVTEKVFTNDDFIVTAAYGESANIPEGAELIVERITADADEEHYAEREAEFKKMMNNEDAVMQALLKIGFYVDGKEVEPESTVTITVQFLDENGLAEGKPVTVVHFADGGTEVLDGSKASNNSTTFQTDGFSEFAFGEGEEEEALANGTSFPVNKSFLYEDDAFHITFKIVGSAFEKKEDNNDVSALDVDGDKDEEDELEKSELEKTDTKNSDEEKKEDDKVEVNEKEVIAEDLDIEGESKYQFKVKVLDEDSEEYKMFAQYAEEIDGEGEQLLLQAMSYSLFYDDTELDLSDCLVSAEITPTATLNKMAQEAIEKIENEEATEEEGKTEESVFAGFKMLEKAPESVAGGNIFQKMGFDNNAQVEENLLRVEEPANKGVLVSTFGIQNDDAGIEGEVSELSSLTLTEGMSDKEIPSMTVNAISSPFASRASSLANPHFQVEYYAYIDRVATEKPEGTMDTLPLIDTSGGRLPKNGNTSSPNENAIKNIYVRTTTGTDARTVETKNTLTQVYNKREYQYWKAPSVNYFDALIQNKNYELEQIWVLNPAGKALLGDLVCGEERGEAHKTHEFKCYEANWTVYEKSQLGDLHFTNRNLGDGYVWLTDESVIRLVYNTTDATPNLAAAFYDYDISDGKIYSNSTGAEAETSAQGEGSWYLKTNQNGINSAGNYTNVSDSDVKFAFGNANTGSGFQHEEWNGNLLNKYNGSQNGHPKVTGSYKGCTFKLVTGLVDGKLQYASGVKVPNLFNDGAANGKTSYDKGEYSLQFNRDGDTYTLSAVTGTNATNLEYFNHPSPKDGVIYDGVTHSSNIWTNNFWPMDSAGSYGTNGHDMKFGDATKLEKRKFKGAAGAGQNLHGSVGNYAAAEGKFPESDDGLDHNAYFGMHYQVEFDLTAEYIGPLEYYFFGDDDMWVFLSEVGENKKLENSKLVCDIGGVHSSVGEYVNLWDHIKDTDAYKDIVSKQEEAWEKETEQLFSKKYVLSFFYTERGESGSTCWMQFTLPSVTSLTPEPNTDTYGQLKVQKVVKQIDGDKETTYENDDQEFTFEIKLDAGAKDDYLYKKYDASNNEITEEGPQLVLHTGSEFTLKNGEYILIDRLPINTQYTITETTERVNAQEIYYTYDTVITDETGKETTVTAADVEQGKKRQVKGTITKKDEGNDVEVNFINRSEVAFNNKFTIYRLPATGGSGIYLYMFGGVLLIMAATLITYRNKRREVLRS